MPNLQRALGATALGLVLSLLGSYAVWTPRTVPPPVATSTPMLSPVYARPAERLETHVLERGQTLSDLLIRQELGGEMAALLLSLRQYANPRRLAEGVEVTVRRWASDGSARAVDVRLNPDSTVRLEPTVLGWSGRIVVTPTTLDTVFLAGTIEEGRTLYEALVYDDELDLPARERVQLVAQLAEIYVYKLDFTHEIRPGDSFRLVYEREARPDGSARSRRVLAAEIENQGESYPAILYRLPGERWGSYYEPSGKSLRLAFRRYPVDYVRVTSSFNPRRYHPILGIYRAHNGTDFGASMGTPVRATGDGTIIFAGRDGGYGNLVRVRHSGGYETRYAHLRGFADSVSRGQAVQQGEIVGYVGATGLATAPHLHYEMRQYGRPVNAATVKLPGAPPIPAAYRAEYREAVEARMALLGLAERPARPALAGAATTTNRKAGATQ
ncbi:MAG: M23 family metallopeptidase [Longimicrobiales bacterium]